MAIIHFGHTRGRDVTYVKSPVGTILFGLVFLAIGIFATIMVWSSGKVPSNYVKIDAVIYDIDYNTTWVGDSLEEDNSVFVEYYVEGEHYIRELDCYMSSFNKGDTIKVAYDPEHPQNVKYADPNVAGWVKYLVLLFPVVGAVVIVSGIVELIRSKKNKQQQPVLHTEDIKKDDQYSIDPKDY